MEKEFNIIEQPSLAESFELEFLNAKLKEVQNAMGEIGGFVVRGSGPEGDGRVYFEGERDDGSKIRIMIEKGEDYKSPAQIAQEEKDAQEDK